jgi:hypothetical protein
MVTGPSSQYEPRQALVIHEFFQDGAVPVCLSTSALGIIAPRAVSWYLFQELRLKPAPGSSGSEIEFRLGIQSPRQHVLPAGVLKSDQLQPSGRPANSANQLPPDAGVGKSRAHLSATGLYVSRLGATENPTRSARGRCARRINSRFHPGDESCRRNDESTA